MIDCIHKVGEGLRSVVVEDLTHADRLRLTFYDYVVNVADLVGPFELLVGEVADEDARRVGLAGALKPRREVHAVSDHCVIHPLR